MQDTKINHAIIKSIGYINYDKSFLEHIKKNEYLEKSFQEETHTFLNNSYHTEYLNIMFPRGNKNGVTRFDKKLNYQVELCRIQTKVLLNNIELFLFNDSYRSEQTAIFSLDYSKEKKILVPI